MDMEFDIQCLQYMALESTIACDPEDYGLPDEKKYPMPDKKHVLLAIKFFNSTEDPEKQKILAANINKRIKDFNMESEVNVGDKNRFKKYWKPSNEAVITTVSPIVPYTKPALKKAESVDDPLLMRFPVKKKKEFKSVILESAFKSDLDVDYKSKGNLSLSNFKKVKVSEITKEMKESPVNFLKLIDDKRDTTYIWKYDDDIVGVGSVRYIDANCNWITAVQINPKYRGYGLGNQILDFCVKELNGNALTVATDNKIALRMYKKYGFKISNESLADVKAGRRKVYFMYLNKNNVPNFPITKSKNKYLIKDENGKKIAELGYYDYSKKDFNWILFADIETDKLHRNEGLGSKLLSRAYSDVIKDNPNNGVYLMVRPDNKVAISFYKKNGFEFVKSVKLKDGNYDLMCKGNADKNQLINMNYS